jgi:hypothetical protein
MGRPVSDVGEMLRLAFIEEGDLHAFGARRVINQKRREQGRRPLSGTYFHNLFIAAERKGLIEFVREEPATRTLAGGETVSLPDLPNRRIFEIVPAARSSGKWRNLPAMISTGNF